MALIGFSRWGFSLTVSTKRARTMLVKFAGEFVVRSTIYAMHLAAW
jgi:hypothetical protein